MVREMEQNGTKTSEVGKRRRVCHVKKWDHFDGYGFNLHAEKGKPGQYVGKVDENSPAEAAGLRHGDRIVEVNGETIADKSHKQVVELIKAVAGEATLLVEDVDEEDGTTVIPKDEPKAKSNGELNLNMTAAELRAKLAARKKFDPKKESMDFKQKFDIVQKL